MSEFPELSGKDIRPTNSAPNIDILRENVAEFGKNVPPEIVAFVERNLIPVSDESSVCIDGRYYETNGEISRPGGDLGLALALVSVGQSPDEAFFNVKNFRLERNQKFGWHSKVTEEEMLEHYVQQNFRAIIEGCEHMGMALKYPHLYGVTENDVLRLTELVATNQAIYPEEMNYATLSDNHDEAGIMIVNYPYATLRHRDVDTEGMQMFVYDVTRDDMLRLDLMLDVLPDGLYNRFETQIERHNELTIGLLASSRGKPIFLLKSNDTSVKVQYMGKAPIFQYSKEFGFEQVAIK